MKNVPYYIAALVALFGDYIKKRLFPPKLTIELKSKSGELTPLKLHDPGINKTSDANARYYHLSVENKGHSIATNTGVYLTSIMLRGAGGDWHQKWNGEALLSWRNGILYLRIIYVPDPDPESVFVITGYELKGKPLTAYRRRRRRRKGR